MSTINMRLQTRQLVETMSNNAQVIIQTPAGNDTFMNKIPKFTLGEYLQTVIGSGSGDEAHYAFVARDNSTKDNLLITTYAVRDSDVGEYVSKPLQWANGTYLTLLNADCVKKGGNWHCLSMHEYAALLYHHYKKTGKAYTGSNFDYPILSRKDVLEAQTGYSDIELNLENSYNGVHLHEFPWLPVAGVRVVNGVFQVKEAGASEKIPELWNTATQEWMWLDADEVQFKKVSDGIDTSKALHFSNSSNKKNYQMAWDFVSIGNLVLKNAVIDQLKILQLYPNKLNPNLKRVAASSDTATWYACISDDCKTVAFSNAPDWSGDGNTGSLLCTFE